MKFQYASDLHLEFKENDDFIKSKPLLPVAPYLILAGDIDVISTGTVTRPHFFQYLSDHWEEVFIIPGNHEYYNGGDVAQSFAIDYEIHPNVRYLNNKSIKIAGVELLFTTLWSRTNTHLINNLISDFRTCRYEDGKFSFIHHDILHDRAKSWLHNQLSKEKTSPRIVVTHFVPCHQANGYPSSGDFSNQVINRYFVADMELDIRNWDVDYWIYGHNHWDKDVDDLGVKFRSNQLGYVFNHEHKGFDFEKVVEL